MDARNFGPNMRMVRTARGMTQGQLAVAADLTMGAICNYEHGTRSPRIASAVRVAEALGVTLDQLCGGEAIDWDALIGKEA